VAWNGETSGSFFSIFATREEAEKMIWVDTGYKNPRTRQPQVRKWRVGISKAGNPIILEPINIDFYGFEGQALANVPYRGEPGNPQGNRLMPTGVPIFSGGHLEGSEPSKSWNRARKALLGYYEKYSK
jgi:hypothetical protein